MANKLNVIALGAGVQSSTMAFMAARGEIKPMPDAAIFADTGAEPDEVMDYFDYLEDELPYPVFKVISKDGLTKEIERSVAGEVNRLDNPPFYTKENNEVGLLNRLCTAGFKIAPIKKKIREMLGLKPGQRVSKGTVVSQWMGISLDEIQRLRESRDKWIEFRYPLVDMRMRRGDCLEWMKRNGYPKPPRSACVYCPYHDNKTWRKIKMTDANAWDEAVRVDKLIRGGIGKTKSKLYLHQSGQPLDEVDFSNDIDRGQLSFLDECEGLCGV
jgi:hypothetical protein